MKLFLSFVFFVLSAILFGQSKLDTVIKNLEENYAQEKVYILYNQQDYVAGETIWFKAFVFDGYQPTSISTTLYVELYDKNKVLIDKKMLPLFNGQGDGSIMLKEDLPEDAYFVRAYTTYMTNFSEDFQYIEPLLIYNPNSKLKLVKNDKAKWIAELFPEAGTFIENQTTKFAVRLKSDGFTPKIWNGYVIDKNNPSKKITEFKGFDENVGSFYMKAESGKNYQLIVQDSINNQQIVDFPVAKKSGVKVEMIRHNNEIKYRLTSINLLNSLKDYKVVVTINHNLFYKAIIKDTRKMSSGIPINQNINGVLQFTLFDENDLYVASRLIFINTTQLLDQLKLKFDVSNNPREINTVTIDNPEAQNYSAFVSTQNSSENLLSALWLNRDFKSVIYNPKQYVDPNKNNDALDALLISETWNRFNWNKLFSGEYSRIKNSSQPYLSYKGKAILNNNLLKNSNLNLVIDIPNSEKQIETLQTNDEGNFELKNLISYSPISVYYFANIKKNKKEDNFFNLSFVPLNNYTAYKGSFINTKYQLSENLTESLKKEITLQMNNQKINKIINNKSIRLKEAVVTAERDIKTKKMNNELSSGMFSSNTNEYVIDFVNVNQFAESYSNILEWLPGRVPGLTIVRNEFSEIIPRIRNSKVDVYLNEMMIDPSVVSNINTNDIAMIKIFKGGLLGNAIAIYLKKGGMGQDTSKNPSKNIYKLSGYDKSIPFLSNDDYEDLYKGIPNDIRQTLYWNPNLISEPNKESIIEFFNNDNPKNYQLTIIGFDKEGNPIFYQGELK